MSTTTTTAATTPALNSYLPVLARLLMCSWRRQQSGRPGNARILFSETS
jgi:hypothetical protein